MAFWTLYKRELNSYFQSAVGYVVLFGSALIQSVFFVLLLKVSIENNIKEASILQMFFTGILFWIFLLGQVPLITMRLFSEEFKLGTIEMLLTAPVREWDIVLAKFFGALTFFMILWLPFVLDLFLVQVFSNPDLLESNRSDPAHADPRGRTLRRDRTFQLRVDEEPDHLRRSLLRLPDGHLLRLALALHPAHGCLHAGNNLLHLRDRTHAKRGAGHL
jgi:hypothetical protein